MSVTVPQTVPGLPILGNALAMQKDPLQFLVGEYLRRGPIFKINLLGRPMTVLAGIEGNQFVIKHGADVLRSKEFWNPVSSDLQTENFLAALDGERHAEFRRIVREPFSKDVMLNQLPRTVEITQRTMQDWKVGDVVAVVPFMRRMIAEQIGQLTLNSGPGDHMRDLQIFLGTMLEVVQGMKPRIALRLPRYQNAKKRLMRLSDQMIAEHERNPQPSGMRDVVDYYLEARKTHPHLVGDAEMFLGAIGPYIAGIDTSAGTCIFMLHSLLQKPDLMQRLTAEVDAAFDEGPLSPDKFRKMPLLHATTIETLRMYPMAPMVQRTATRDFEFNGAQVRAGETVMVGTCVAHFAPTVYREPHTFDETRALPPRNEHRQMGAFMPYGYGVHTCAGAGLAEVQIAVALATILRTVRVELADPNWKMRMVLNPTPAPDAGFRVRVVERRS